MIWKVYAQNVIRPKGMAIIRWMNMGLQVVLDNQNPIWYNKYRKWGKTNE